MKIERFEDIDAWMEARRLVRIVYHNFIDVKDYGMKTQIERAAISVMANIAEGFQRASNREFIQFLVISRGSVGEVKSISYAAMDLGYISSGIHTDIINKCEKLTSIINGFIRYLKHSSRKN